MKTNENNTTTATADQSTKSTVLLAIDKIRPNPNNPRRSYDENALAELAASIATHGLIQPIRVRTAEQGGPCGRRFIRRRCWRDSSACWRPGYGAAVC